MLDQFGSEPEPSAYTIQVDKAQYKLFRRLQTLTQGAKIELSLDERGKLRSIRVFLSKEEVLCD